MSMVWEWYESGVDGGESCGDGVRIMNLVFCKVGVVDGVIPVEWNGSGISMV